MAIPPSTDESANATPLPRQPSPPAAKKRRTLKIAVGVAAATGIVVTAIGATAWTKMHHLDRGHPGDPTPRELIGLLSPNKDKAQFPGHSRVNILVVGKDYNRNSKGMEYTKGSRADTIMMLSLDFDSGRVSALSIPRDTRVTAPDGQTGKINGTYARGGAQLLRETVTKLLGVAPDYVISAKPDAVRVMVDKLGGVEVESIDAMNYDDNWGQLHIHLPKGKMTLNGEQAVGFGRFREVKRGTPHSREEGDPRRMARQQQLIRAMAAKGKSFGNLLQLDEIADTALDQFETDMTRTQTLALVLYFRNLHPEDIQSGSLAGKGTTSGTYFFMPDEQKKTALVDWLLKGDESAANRLTVVAVENGSTVEGASDRATAALRTGGFDAENEGTPQASTVPSLAPSAVPSAVPTRATTQIQYAKAGMAVRAQKIAQLLRVPAAQVVKADRPDTTGSYHQSREDHADVTVILGQDTAAAFGPQSAER